MITPVENHAPAKLAVTMLQAGEMLSVCERTVSRLCDAGELRRIRIGNRGIRIAVADLQAWIAKQQEAVQS